MKLFKSKKGMTLLETILALAVLGIVAAPLLTVFTNAAVIVKKTNDRLEINAITRIIKENVTSSVKYGEGHEIYSYDDTEDIVLKTAINGNGKGLQIKGTNDEINPRYKFDAERIVDFGDLSYSTSAAITLADTCEYLITLKTMDGDMVQKLRILVNRIDSP